MYLMRPEPGESTVSSWGSFSRVNRSTCGATMTSTTVQTHLDMPMRDQTQLERRCTSCIEEIPCLPLLPKSLRLDGSVSNSSELDSRNHSNAHHARLCGGAAIMLHNFGQPAGCERDVDYTSLLPHNSDTGCCSNSLRCDRHKSSRRKRSRAAFFRRIRSLYMISKLGTGSLPKLSSGGDERATKQPTLRHLLRHKATPQLLLPKVMLIPMG